VTVEQLLQFEKENDVTLPMSSFVDFDLKRKIRHKKSLSDSEILRLIEGFNRLHLAIAWISECCVSKSKQHYSSRQSVEEIRKVLDELY